jgi:hypothetical protein
LGESLDIRRNSAPASPESKARLRQFLHDVAAPLSAVALHLEAAARRVAQGEDPTRSLDIARGELARAFELFESGREELLKAAERDREDRRPEERS